MADRARYAANSDGRTERRRERRAAESCELARETVIIIMEVLICSYAY